MKPTPSDDHVPDSLERALDLLHEYGDHAKFLAGEQSPAQAIINRISPIHERCASNHCRAFGSYRSRTGIVGLEIGAGTPEEIAMSIMAEIVTVRNNAEQGANPQHEKIRI